MTFDEWFETVKSQYLEEEKPMLRHAWFNSAWNMQEAVIKICEVNMARFVELAEKYDCQEEQPYINRSWGAEECLDDIRKLNVN